MQKELQNKQFNSNIKYKKRTNCDSRMERYHMADIIFDFKGYNGSIQVYKDRIIISRNNFMSLISVGLAGEKVISMSSIKAVQYRAGGLINGFIQFEVGGRQVTMRNATQDENTVIILAGRQSEEAKRIKEYVENRIFEIENSKNQPVIQQNSAADEVLKLKQLLDMGVLTQEEFDKKKKEILGL